MILRLAQDGLLQTEAKMARLDQIRTEIDALLAELAKAQASQPGGEDAAPAGDAQHPLADAMAALGQLRDQLEDAAKDAGDAVGEHPVAAIASAFLLGLVIGRISKGL
jgi:ElaB/YqjD/DUF883 family membrane-anchored ribosome-binding protein